MMVIVLGIIFMGNDAKASVQKTATVIQAKKIKPTSMVVKDPTGEIVNIGVAGKVATVSEATHYLKNFRKTTWHVTKKLTLSANGKTGTYYYLKNAKGTVKGYAKASDLKKGVTATTLLTIAKKQLGKSYRLGAVGPSSFDCSGFTSYVFKKAAKKTISRTAQAQYASQKHVKKARLKKGDLAFFGSSAANITHVGLYIGHGKMINAQSRGVITERINAPWWHVVGYSRPMAVSQF